MDEATTRIDPDLVQNADAGRNIIVRPFHGRSTGQCENNAAMAICLDDFAQSIRTDGAGMVGLAPQGLDPEDFRRLWDRIMRLCGVYQNRITESLSRKI
ncbi:hypothetical protein AJ88_22025 [Mesorhizobium amorphae CCBAU 01583]|nr:hypothetical protein AJ88_22025 [Mesorhizobium amorphae CCBAU 01583]